MRLQRVGHGLATEQQQQQLGNWELHAFFLKFRDVNFTGWFNLYVPNIFQNKVLFFFLMVPLYLLTAPQCRSTEYHLVPHVLKEATESWLLPVVVIQKLNYISLELEIVMNDFINHYVDISFLMIHLFLKVGAFRFLDVCTIRSQFIPFFSI